MEEGVDCSDRSYTHKPMMFNNGITPEEYFRLPLPERFRIFMLEEMCDEEKYRQMMKLHNNAYLPILEKLRLEMPDLFFLYFNDLLPIEE